jgi:4-hydroxy-tetrahydrodipicolinate reductase
MRIGLSGSGKMGTALHRLGQSQGHEMSFDFGQDLDVAIDFSHPDCLADMLALNCPVVIGTTGYSEDQMDAIEQMAQQQPVFYASNYSVGVAVMNRLVRQLAVYLQEDFDFALVEKHHRYKLDAPSGTAKTMLETLEQVGQTDVPVQALRFGTIVGEHEVIAAGTDEVLSIKHEALSRDIFANGALKAAQWLVNQAPGLYDMEDLLFSGEK